MLVFTERKDYLFRDQNREEGKCEDVGARRVVPIRYGTHGSVLCTVSYPNGNSGPRWHSLLVGFPGVGNRYGKHRIMSGK